MSNTFNKISIIDLEATCWEDKEKQWRYSEIIEIGCALIDVQKAEIIDNRSIYVFPTQQVGMPISEYCTKLTGITTNLLMKRGKTLIEAIAELKKHYPTGKTWMSWGAYDQNQLLKECKAKSIEFPFRMGYHVNAKNLFGLVRKDKGKSVGLAKAMELFDLKFEGRQHSGKDDAYNIARVVCKLLWGMPPVTAEPIE